MTANFSSHEERLVQQFKDSTSYLSDEDLEDLKSEVMLMSLEGIDLSTVTVRDLMKRLGILN